MSFVDGLLLKFEYAEGFTEPTFWEFFSPIRQDLDRLYWCFVNQPWMCAPAEFKNDVGAMIPFEGCEKTSGQLWCPSALGRYADQFAEEFIDLWGIEPTDDPQVLAAQYSRSPS